MYSLSLASACFVALVPMLLIAVYLEQRPFASLHFKMLLPGSDPHKKQKLPTHTATWWGRTTYSNSCSTPIKAEEPRSSLYSILHHITLYVCIILNYTTSTQTLQESAVSGLRARKESEPTAETTGEALLAVATQRLGLGFRSSGFRV